MEQVRTIKLNVSRLLMLSLTLGSMATSVAPADATFYTGPSQTYFQAEEDIKSAIQAGLDLPATGPHSHPADNGFDNVDKVDAGM